MANNLLDFNFFGLIFLFFVTAFPIPQHLRKSFSADKEKSVVAKIKVVVRKRLLDKEELARRNCKEPKEVLRPSTRIPFGL
ncbi:hypothetical protein Sjap_001468 [Stephania japonica]|uniref:Uncharacterized protein n=1 Tax=Stephania japonica TaxID=461633 RepID=A0AAP0KJZ6_9MAGN